MFCTRSICYAPALCSLRGHGTPSLLPGFFAVVYTLILFCKPSRFRVSCVRVCVFFFMPFTLLPGTPLESLQVRSRVEGDVGFYDDRAPFAH